MSNDGLFDPDATLRFAASTAFSGSHVKNWPRGCRGAANGWLMLVGPSPGRQDTDDDIWAGGPDRPNDESASIGPTVGVVNYGTNKGRNKRWNMLSEAVFGRLDHARALTSTTNLDWGHHADSKGIPEPYLRAGCPVVYGLMTESKPVVVVTLTLRTWDVFAPYLLRKAQVVSDDRQARELDSLVIRLPGFAANSLVIRSPQHPSQPFFTQQHADLVRSEVASFVQASRK